MPELNSLVCVVSWSMEHICCAFISTIKSHIAFDPDPTPFPAFLILPFGLFPWCLWSPRLQTRRESVVWFIHRDEDAGGTTLSTNDIYQCPTNKSPALCTFTGFAWLELFAAAAADGGYMMINCCSSDIESNAHQLDELFNERCCPVRCSPPSAAVP